MSSKAPKIKALLLFFGFLVVLILFWASKSVVELKKSTQSGWFDPPTEIYSSPVTLRVNQRMDPARLSELFNNMEFKERGVSESLGKQEYTFMSYSTCEERFGITLERDTRTCFLSVLNRREQYLLEVSYERILKIHEIQVDKSTLVSKVEYKPILLTKLSNKKPVKRTYKKLSHIPRYCIDAVLAIEDDRFLSHRGVSIRGILRAALTNFKSGRISQGGSTLTQQLVKNKFLSSERTLTRKIKEAWLSVTLELVLSKDEILESYLNYIYWGQLGPYAIHGIEEASLHYFGKSAEKLNLSECSLLAGAVKGPGIYGPNKEKSKLRQEQVLDRMVALDLISKDQEREALLKVVRLSMNKSFSPPKAPYYVDALFKELESMGYKDLNGFKIFTFMDIFIQNSLEKSMDRYLKTDSKDFYGSLIVGDPSRHTVIALTSGTSLSQNFNSAIEAKRQIGSLAKPFVYLTAFQTNDTYTPLTEVSNDPFIYEYEGQEWKPKNYSRDATPFYPIYLSLAKSKNRPTVRLMSEFGYKKVYSTLMNYGFSEFSPVTPSLGLGSFEASPFEVLGAYMSLSRMSPQAREGGPGLLKALLSKDDGVLYESSSSLYYEEIKPKLEERMLIEMMKNTLKLGTARRTQALNLKGIYAGKTGTTNNYKDGWFVAMSPQYTFVTWLGESEYTKRKKIKLTGATGALPIWMLLIKSLEDQGLYTEEDWPLLDLEPIKLQSLEGEATLLLRPTSE